MDTRRSAFLLLVIIYLGFISLGLPDGTFGVAWPAIYPDLGLPIGVAGVVTVVGTLLSGMAGFMSGRIIARFRTGPVVAISCMLTGAALLITGHAQNLAWLIAAAVPLGLGAGAVDAGLNGFVARHYTGRHMNWLHACWGIGATCGPLWMGRALAQEHGWRTGYIALGAVQLGLAVVFILSLRLWATIPGRRADADSGVSMKRIPTTPARSFAGWLSPLIFAFYVAAEATTGLWAASILIVARDFSPSTAALCSAGFYASITGGRVAVGFVVERWGNRRLIDLGTVTALLGAVGFIFATTPALAAGTLFLIGVGLAPVYPCLMHEVPRRFAPDAVQTVIGRQSGAANFGAALLPAAAGWLAQVSLESIAWIIVGGVLTLIGAIWKLNRLT